MRSLVRILFVLIILSLPLSIGATAPAVQIVKKPLDMKITPGMYYGDLTAKDRSMWKSVLHWCDECDEKAKPSVDAESGCKGIYVYPLGGNEYIVGVNCSMTMRQSEHIIYKVTEQYLTIESRLLRLEQFYFVVSEHSVNDMDPYKEREEKGKFIRFTDPLIYGFANVDKEKKHLIIYKEYRGIGGCGLQTTYDVSGDTPKVVDFRGKTYCSSNYVPPEKWRRYPAKQRAKWPIGPNPLREDWKNKDQCR